MNENLKEKLQDLKEDIFAVLAMPAFYFVIISALILCFQLRGCWKLYQAKQDLMNLTIKSPSDTLNIETIKLINEITNPAKPK